MNDNSQLITVRFSAPVEGIDPSDGEVFLATRHRIAAVYARQDRSETVFINDDGEVVARWATRLVVHIDWPDGDKVSSAAEVKPSVGTLEWRKNVQERHPRAYQRWTPEEDVELTDQFRAGYTVAEMAKMHNRRRGGISARLVRLDLIGPDTPESQIGRSDRTAQAAIADTTAPAVVATVPPVGHRLQTSSRSSRSRTTRADTTSPSARARSASTTTGRLCTSRPAVSAITLGPTARRYGKDNDTSTPEAVQPNRSNWYIEARSGSRVVTHASRARRCDA